MNLNVDKWYEAVSNSNNNIGNKEMNKDKNKNKNEKMMINIDRNKIKNNSLSSPLSRSANKKMNNQTKDKLLAHALEPNSHNENKIKIENNFLKFEKLLKCSTIEEKKIKKKDLNTYGERKIVQKVSGKKMVSDFRTNFITENITSKKNTRINSKPCSKKNRNSQISFESSFGPKNVLFNGKDTSYVEFLSSVNLIRENIVKGTKAARTEIHPSTDTIGNMELHREEREGEEGVEERKSDYDSDSLSPNTHNMRNFEYSDVDISKSGISDPESLNNSIRDVLINSYNASLHDSMIDTYDVFNTVRTAESLKQRSDDTGITVSYSVPPTSIPVPVPMAATSHSHHQRNQNVAIKEYKEEQEEEGIAEREGEREKEVRRDGTKTQSESVIGTYEKSESTSTSTSTSTPISVTKTKTQMETGMGTRTGMETGRGRGRGVEEIFIKAERSSEDWIAWARQGARLPLSDSINNIINTNNLTSTATSTSMQNKSEDQYQDLGSEVGIKGNVFYQEDFLPVFSTKVIESSRNINEIEYDYVGEEKMQGTTNGHNDNKKDDEISVENESGEQINNINNNDNYNNDNNYHKKSDNKKNKLEVENNRYKVVENEDEDDLLVYDMPQYYDDYYEYNRVLDNNNTYYENPITVNDNDTTQSYNAKEYNEEDRQFETKTKTEMNIYTELDETDPYTVSSEPYNFEHGIRRTHNSSVRYEKDYDDGKDFYRAADKVRGKVKVGKHKDKEENYYSNKGIAFPSRGTRTYSRIKIKSAESSDLSDYHGPSAAILESYMKGIYKQSYN